MSVSFILDHSGYDLKIAVEPFFVNTWHVLSSNQEKTLPESRLSPWLVGSQAVLVKLLAIWIWLGMS
jgi:hypothetical protein